MNTKEVIQLLRQGSDEITAKIIRELINEHASERKRTLKLYQEYRGDVEIKKREFDDTRKVNNKLPHDYRGDIIDQITGYLFGEPISYIIDKSKYSDRDYQNVVNELDSFKARNNIDDLDSLTGEMASICGYAVRLLYVDKEGKERAMNVNPWEVILVKHRTIDAVQYGLIYYDIEVIEGDKRSMRKYVEFYDEKNIHFFIETENGSFVRDFTESENPKPHLFDGVPLIRFENNNILMGDFEKVDDLIDAYDRVMSDEQNEIEEFRLALLAIYGAEADEEELKKAKKLGAISFPDGTDGKFLVKPLDQAVEFVKAHRDVLNENIYKFSKSIDMRNEKFSGSSISGESRKWQLVPLENKAKTKERKFVKALRQQFKLLQSAWNKKQIPFDYETLKFQFTRNLPVDLKYHAETTQMLKGNISDETRLALLPFIGDPEKELQRMKDEMGDAIDFGAPRNE